MYPITPTTKQKIMDTCHITDSTFESLNSILSVTMSLCEQFIEQCKTFTDMVKGNDDLTQACVMIMVDGLDLSEVQAQGRLELIFDYAEFDIRFFGLPDNVRKKLESFSVANQTSLIDNPIVEVAVIVPSTREIICKHIDYRDLSAQELKRVLSKTGVRTPFKVQESRILRGTVSKTGQVVNGKIHFEAGDYTSVKLRKAWVHLCESYENVGTLNREITAMYGHLRTLEVLRSAKLRRDSNRD